MQIGGLVRQSFIDYPGKMAAVIFTNGCNFRCRYCHNPQLVLPELIRKEKSITSKEIYNFLANRQGWLDSVVVTGGEPTLHTDLADFIKRIKAFNYNIKLDTNGTNPEMLKKLFDEKLINYIAMDIKAPLRLTSYRRVVGSYFSQKMLSNVLKSIEIIKQSGIDFEFRTTLDRSLNDIAKKEILAQLHTNVTWQNVIYSNTVLENIS